MLVQLLTPCMFLVMVGILVRPRRRQLRSVIPLILALQHAVQAYYHYPELQQLPL